LVAEAEVQRDAIWPLAGLTQAEDVLKDVQWPLRAAVFNVLLQIRSNGHGKEWPADRYVELVSVLPKDRFHFIVNGTPSEGTWLRTRVPELFELSNVTDATSGFPVGELVRMLPQFDGVVANSTGPMHLAALSGVPTLGLFVPVQGMDPQRWGPLGARAEILVAPSAACVRCAAGVPRCPCMDAIDVERVAGVLTRWERER
jgi:ADP-heptose:LPS heptosyltransferase